MNIQRQHVSGMTVLYLNVIGAWHNISVAMNSDSLYQCIILHTIINVCVYMYQMLGMISTDYRYTYLALILLS